MSQFKKKNKITFLFSNSEANYAKTILKIEQRKKKQMQSFTFDWKYFNKLQI